MKKTSFIILTLLACLLTAASVCAQAGEMTRIAAINSETPVSQMVWDLSGDLVTEVSRDMYSQNRVEPEPMVQEDGSSFGAYVGSGFSFWDRGYTLTAVSGSGVMAALSADRRTIDVFTKPMDSEKSPLSIEPEFSVLSIAVSDDGELLLADSADEIRTVVYNTADGKAVYDLNGFGTAAPVYDSMLSADNSHVVWHSRGTFAVQDAETGAFGETVSLWDFASAYALAPDNGALAVSIINEDYENGTVIFFDPQTGAEAGRTDLGAKAPYELMYSADGSVLLAADAETVYWIDPESFALLGQRTVVTSASDETRISQAAPSPDGSYAAVLLSSGDLYLAAR